MPLVWYLIKFSLHFVAEETGLLTSRGIFVCHISGMKIQFWQKNCTVNGIASDSATSIAEHACKTKTMNQNTKSERPHSESGHTGAHNKYTALIWLSKMPVWRIGGPDSETIGRRAIKESLSRLVSRTSMLTWCLSKRKISSRERDSYENPRGLATGRKIVAAGGYISSESLPLGTDVLHNGGPAQTGFEQGLASSSRLRRIGTKNTNQSKDSGY
ncbi:hypothetical protein R3P38DRAFT_2779520 [Favolaschia claudopus]|uniref:Uncharacterized protein n=1 Tax=Favolaschia claudopus TaxID=2862362 RepID=A0AAW0BC86_9AGAR